MFNHWATGLRSGLLPHVVVLQQTPEVDQKKGQIWAKFWREFCFLVPGEGFFEGVGRFSEVSRIFFTGSSPPSGRVGGEL